MHSACHLQNDCPAILSGGCWLTNLDAQHVAIKIFPLTRSLNLYKTCKMANHRNINRKAEHVCLKTVHHLVKHLLKPWHQPLWNSNSSYQHLACDVDSKMLSFEQQADPNGSFLSEDAERKKNKINRIQYSNWYYWHAWWWNTFSDSRLCKTDMGRNVAQVILILFLQTASVLKLSLGPEQGLSAWLA